MAETNWRPDAGPSIIDHIGKVLRETTHARQNEPLPERWIELIQRLNAEEDAFNQRTRCEPPRS